MNEQFSGIWLSTRERRISDVLPYEDIGVLTITGDGVRFQGIRRQLTIPRNSIKRVSYGKQGTDNNDWVHVVYGDYEPYQTAYFAMVAPTSADPSQHTRDIFHALLPLSPMQIPD